MNNIEKSVINIVKCAINDIKEQSFDFSNEELRQIFIFSKKHAIEHIVAYGLKINSALPADSEISKAFESAIFKACFSVQQTTQTANKVFKILNNSKVDFLPLKGAVIREFYPQDWMRTSSDTDILIKNADIDKAISAIESETDFKSELPGRYDVSLFSENMHQHLELHFSLIENKHEKLHKPLIDIWEHTECNDGNEYYHKMLPEYFMYYHYAHIVKHFKFGGCGIKNIIDTYLLNRSLKYEKNKLSILLKSGGIEVVADAIEKIAFLWFGDIDIQDDFLDLQDYILNSGVYGNMENRVNNKNMSKLKYIIYRIFMPYNELKYLYPSIEKYKYFILFYWIRRFFDILKKGKFYASLNEIKTNLSMSDSVKNSHRDFLKKYNID